MRRVLWLWRRHPEQSQLPHNFQFIRQRLLTQLLRSSGLTILHLLDEITYLKEKQSVSWLELSVSSATRICALNQLRSLTKFSISLRLGRQNFINQHTYQATLCNRRFSTCARMRNPPGYHTLPVLLISHEMMSVLQLIRMLGRCANGSIP